MALFRTAAVAAVPLALIVLLAAVPVIGGAQAASPATAALFEPGTAQWAYGASLNATATWTNSSGGYTASLTAYYGWQTILTQTNGSNGSIQLEVQRTAAVDYWLSFCKPSCTIPTWTGSITYQAWETDVGFANLTTNGAVTVNGTQIPGLALENESNHVRGNITEAVTATYHGILKLHTAEYYFSVNASSDMTLSFSPALGLVPDTLAPGLLWNSTSAFTGVGGWSAHYDSEHIPITGSPIRFSGPISGSVAGTGRVDLQGADDGAFSLDDGQSASALSIQIEGPFHIYEGFLLLPSQSDVLGSGGSAWASYQNDSAVSATASADFASNQPHLGLLASSTSYAPQPTSQSTLVDAGAVSGIAPAAVPLGPTAAGSSPSDGGAVVQGQPETVSGSQGQTPCLVAGNCVSPVAVPGASHASGVIGLLVVGLLVGTLVALAVVVSRRREIPPPSHPNARLYPTVPLPGPVPPLGKPPATEESTAADDPLGHLW
jgi:hypothetical protein